MHLVWLALALALSASPEAAEAPLGDEQAGISRRFGEFESLVERMADLLARSDPERAALLRKVFALSRKELLREDMEKLAAALRSGDLPGSVKLEQGVLERLESLLDLLLSEDRARQVKERRERLEKEARAIAALRHLQVELRQKTERLSPPGAPPAQLEVKQAHLASRAEKLADRLSKEATDKSAKTPGAAEKDSAREGEPKSDKERAGAAEKHSRAASQKMREAEARLKTPAKSQATGPQDEAIRSLEKAGQELEEILRQLREEERQQVLVSLAARLRKMREIEEIVREGTVAADKVPRNKRTRADEQRAVALARRQLTLHAEIEQALVVIREDGTSVAIGEALAEVDVDVMSIARALEHGDTGQRTQEVESEVIAVLEDLIAAIDRQIREGGGKAPSGSGGSNAAPPLVSQLAELKMLRALEERVWRRTERLLALPPAARQAPDARADLADLAERQARIYRVAKELAAGGRQ